MARDGYLDEGTILELYGNLKMPNTKKENVMRLTAQGIEANVTTLFAAYLQQLKTPLSSEDKIAVEAARVLITNFLVNLNDIAENTRYIGHGSR